MILKSLFFTIIQPLVLLIEVIFTNMYRLFSNAGIAIIMVSLTVNLLILPLYKRSDALQERERAKQKEMEHWVNLIKRSFKGDERFMMLSTYYRQENYKPMNALSGSLSLLLQIPFFMAAYHYLSSADLQGASFLFLRNLGEADHLIKIGAISLNLMPILMTGINCISGAIYTRGFALKDKIQLYVLAGLFLIVLYRSPSGLVLYWTLNNLFSLFKNVVMKLFNHGGEKETERAETFTSDNKRSARLFLVSGLALTFLLGLTIPSSVVVASPEEFITLNAYRNPLVFVWLSLCTAFGVFMVWGGILYYLAAPKAKKIFSHIYLFISLAAILDFMAFGSLTGTVSPILTYHEGLVFRMPIMLINLGLVLLIILAVVLFRNKEKAWTLISGVLAMGLLFLGILNVTGAESEIKAGNYLKTSEEAKMTEEEIQPILTLDKNGKNVVVFMLDRAISDYFPYILNERPELKEKFSGFTYYPNTISFGQYTVYASAALFGGYEYMPASMNERDSEPMVDKQNEALKVMPALFSEAGYKVTVCDPPLAGYREIPDLSIYDEYENIDTHITMGAYLPDGENYVKEIMNSQERNFFCYSFMKSLPLALQRFAYDYGSYFESTRNTSYSAGFLKSYTVLENLSALTLIRDSSDGGFVMIDNETTHSPCLLQMPDYEPKDNVNNGSYENSDRFTLNGRTMQVHDSFALQHYHVNAASLIKMGEWFDYLKEQGVYDNTRIIIVSDHGRCMKQFDDLMITEDLDLEGYHPLLLVKDFDSEELAVSDEFMTNADVPAIALNGVVDEPVNPFTGNLLDGREKNEKDLLVTTAENFDEEDRNTLNTAGGSWYRFSGSSIYDKNSWTKVE